MTRYTVSFLYLIGIIAANVLVGFFGELAVVIVPFLFVSLTMISRDILHDRVSRLWMFGLIAIGSIISYLLNYGIIALASFTAFAVSESIDYFIYKWLRGRFMARAVVSTIISSIIDSIIFIHIAFGFDLNIVIMQSLAKIIGSTILAFVYCRINNKPCLKIEE